jgi:hypothetical protein
LVEHYADTVKAKGSSPLVITKLRLNSMVENYRYKIGVVGSKCSEAKFMNIIKSKNEVNNPTVATNWFVAQLDESIRLLPGGL